MPTQHVWLRRCVLLAVLTAACGQAPSSPTSAADGPGQLRIVGPGGPLAVGATAQLTAQFISACWGCDDDVGYPSLELWCGGQMLRREAAPYRGGEIVQTIAAPAACEVRMKQWPPDTRTQYRIAIT